MRRLKIEEVPKTRKEFLKKWREDHIFRSRAQNMGFQVLFNENVVLPDGQIAGKDVE